MIGSALKKLAKEHEMKVDRGVAYGAMRGYAVTMFEGQGYKMIGLATSFPDGEGEDAFIDEVNKYNLYKEFRIQNLAVAPNGLVIRFHDNPGTMKKLRAFLDVLFPLLDRYGAVRYNICSECGMPIERGKWFLRDGVMAFYYHDACAERVKRSLEADNEQRKMEDTGSYVSGFIGSFMGSLVGAAVWALIYYLGYFASIIGLGIGWLAQKGYDLLKGRQGRGKVWILIFSVIFGVVFGTLLGDAISLAVAINSGELAGFVMGDIPLLMLVLFEDMEYVKATVIDIAMGLLFAGLGVFYILKRAHEDTADSKIVELK